MNADFAFTYTQLAVFFVFVMVVWDLFVVRTQLLKTKIFWASYAIIVFFQLVSNGLLTGFRMVQYYDEAIIGSGSVDSGTPQMLGDGRIFYAPVEDLLFGFSLVMLTLTLWVIWERRGIQKSIVAGPPRISAFGPKK
ncbi:MAG: hypothetical protein RLZZ426_713 [Actinomycetota bacterium]|jgi:hypothetical protein